MLSCRRLQFLDAGLERARLVVRRGEPGVATAAASGAAELHQCLHSCGAGFVAGRRRWRQLDGFPAVAASVRFGRLGLGTAGCGFRTRRRRTSAGPSATACRARWQHAPAVAFCRGASGPCLFDFRDFAQVRKPKHGAGGEFPGLTRLGKAFALAASDLLHQLAFEAAVAREPRPRPGYLQRCRPCRILEFESHGVSPMSGRRPPWILADGGRDQYVEKCPGVQKGAPAHCTRSSSSRDGDGDRFS